jgi:hypothetical protein
MNQNQKDAWVEYLDEKHSESNSNELLRIEFNDQFFNRYPVYTVVFNDYTGDNVFFWHILVMGDCWYEDHTKDVVAYKKEGEFIPRILNNNFGIYKKYFNKIRSLMTFIKYPFIGYEKNYATFIILCFKKSKHGMPNEMICLILSFLRRADIKEKNSLKSKNYFKSFMDYFPIFKSLFS